MKRLAILSLLLFLCTCLGGCMYNDPKYINLTKKPSVNYYTSTLTKEFMNNSNYSVYIFDTNLYKDIQVPDSEKNIVQSFIKSLSSENFSNVSEITEKEPYRVKIVFNDGRKYVIKVFNSKEVSIFPWDGSYIEDTANIENIPLGYNIYDFCNHIHNKAQNNEN